MQIAAGTVKLSSQALSYRSQERRQHLELWVGDRPSRGGPPSRPSTAIASADANLFRSLALAAKARPAEPEPSLDPDTERMLLILEKLFGVKGVRGFALRMQAVQSDLKIQQAQGQGQQRAGWGMVYEESTKTVSCQSASLSAEGSLTLADGSSLAFKLDWSQSAMQVRESSTRVALGDAKLQDPLVIDLDGNGLAFSGTMPLALGAVGTATVARPAGADALLVNDANGNGRVDNGEVVGASSGQAFAELARLDSNGNGWIDQGDAVWTRLRLLDGSGTLRPLDGSVAAISTSSVTLPYEHRDADGALQAVGRRGGVAIGADGVAKAVAQVDLVA